MRQRCNNSSNGAYHRYGGRGIKVCERWDASFQAFYDDMGPRPTSGHEIERIDNDGPYSPENCRWATCKEQANNRRSNHIVTYFGKEMTLMEFGKECGLGWSTVRRRMVDFGMTPEEATARPLVGYR